MENTYVYSLPVGYVKVVDNGEAVTELSVTDNCDNSCNSESYVAKMVYVQLKEYFEGKRKQFTLKLQPKGTDFAKSVWKALVTIPYGETRSYKDIAKAVGKPKASRAVGGANNRNPIMILIPCHRVVGADGSLTGYAYGLDMKRQLLELESIYKNG